MKRKLFLVTILGSMLLGSTAVDATTTTFTGTGVNDKAPWTAQDFFRSVTGVIESIINLCGEGEAKAQLIATQEEDNQNACGGSGSADSTNTSVGRLNPEIVPDSEFSGSAFDYVNAGILGKEGNVGYSPLKTALASAQDEETVRANIRTAVLREFFANPTRSEQTTTEYKNKIRSQRNKYVQEAAGRHVSLGYRVKGYIQNDLASISSAAVSGDGELGSIAVDAHTLEQMVKMELVDLALQIEMMEADAIHFLVSQPIELMSETKPTS